jgi:hypothetical protein
LIAGKTPGGRAGIHCPALCKGNLLLRASPSLPLDSLLGVIPNLKELLQRRDCCKVTLGYVLRNGESHQIISIPVSQEICKPVGKLEDVNTAAIEGLEYLGSKASKRPCLVSNACYGSSDERLLLLKLSIGACFCCCPQVGHGRVRHHAWPGRRNRSWNWDIDCGKRRGSGSEELSASLNHSADLWQARLRNLQLIEDLVRRERRREPRTGNVVHRSRRGGPMGR